jgi:endonuclease/exonuclease/phosphatase (EEP) superfamily protein YafD
LPTLVVGDLNATPWSSAFKGLGLKRAGDLTGTWPAALGAFGLPLDHVLVSTHWSVAAAHVHGGLGSDHLALIVSLTRVD